MAIHINHFVFQDKNYGKKDSIHHDLMLSDLANLEATVNEVQDLDALLAQVSGDHQENEENQSQKVRIRFYARS